jgi:dTDP-4-amino-4,6-dideoxygalactose transaminase
VYLPRAPVLDWSSFKRTGSRPGACIDELPHAAITSSGRAALYQALLQLQLPAGSTVLVPTYHCPTMVAPVVCAGLKPVFFGLQADGLPNLDTIDPAIGRAARAIIVAQYFGLPRSLAAVREWCDRNDVTLIEDCAHSFFGQAGDRPVGHWGDYATASFSKFFPVPEAGLLASASRPLKPLSLNGQSAKAQLKGIVDVLQVAVDHGRLGGLNRLLSPIFGWKSRASRFGPRTEADSTSEEVSLQICDMGRIDATPLGVSLWLNRALPRGRVAARRHANFALYAERFSAVTGARPVFDAMSGATAPYVFPLWVDDAERVYRSLHTRRFPVFRWDRIWPGTPALAGDVGPLWSRHVLQLLCHQDLSTQDVECTASAVLELLQATRATND